MNPPNVAHKTYVDIAMVMAVQDGDYHRPQSYVPDRWNSKGTLAELDFEVNEMDLLKQVWSDRIERWRILHPDGGPLFENCKSLEEFNFEAFFLQYPTAAIPLWNVMQSFYALDRLVCCTREQRDNKVSTWELMPYFEYLDARPVEKRWRASLKRLRSETEMKTTRDELLNHIGEMWNGIVDLEDACSGLQRSFQENLKGIKLADLMFERIKAAVGRRFAMIDNNLRVHGSSQDEKDIEDSFSYAPEYGINDSASNFEARQPKTNPGDYPRGFQPPRRTNSINTVKRHLFVAWTATNEGQASVRAIAMLGISIFCLRQVQDYLVSLSPA